MLVAELLISLLKPVLPESFNRSLLSWARYFEERVGLGYVKTDCREFQSAGIYERPAYSLFLVFTESSEEDKQRIEAILGQSHAAEEIICLLLNKDQAIRGEQEALLKSLKLERKAQVKIFQLPGANVTQAINQTLTEVSTPIVLFSTPGFRFERSSAEKLIQAVFQGQDLSVGSLACVSKTSFQAAWAELYSRAHNLAEPDAAIWPLDLCAINTKCLRELGALPDFIEGAEWGLAGHFFKTQHLKMQKNSQAKVLRVFPGAWTALWAEQVRKARAEVSGGTLRFDYYRDLLFTSSKMALEFVLVSLCFLLAADFEAVFFSYLGLLLLIPPLARFSGLLLRRQIGQAGAAGIKPQSVLAACAISGLDLYGFYLAYRARAKTLRRKLGERGHYVYFREECFRRNSTEPEYVEMLEKLKQGYAVSQIFARYPEKAEVYEHPRLELLRRSELNLEDWSKDYKNALNTRALAENYEQKLIDHSKDAFTRELAQHLIPLGFKPM